MIWPLSQQCTSKGVILPNVSFVEPQIRAYGLHIVPQFENKYERPKEGIRAFLVYLHVYVRRNAGDMNTDDSIVHLHFMTFIHLFIVTGFSLPEKTSASYAQL